MLEFVALTDPTLAPIIHVDIENGLKYAFQQKKLKFSGKNFILLNVWHVLTFALGFTMREIFHQK